MRGAAFLLAISIVSTGAGCPGKSGPATPAEPVSHTSAEIVDGATRLVEQWRQAWQLRSADTLKALYAHDVDVVIVSQGRAHLGWTAVEAWLDAEVGRSASVHLAIEGLSIGALGDGAASLVCTLRREISDGVSAASELGQLTMALRAEGAGWVIVAEHYSFPSTM